jgi:chromosome segregation ATPase
MSKHAIIDLSPDQLRAQIDQIKAQVETLNTEFRRLQDQRHELEARLTELTVPYRAGDIVIDERKVEYRVVDVRPSGQIRGLRLTKQGYEAQKDPRTIWSNKLRKVE